MYINKALKGRLAQLVERFVYTEEVSQVQALYRPPSGFVKHLTCLTSPDYNSPAKLAISFYAVNQRVKTDTTPFSKLTVNFEDYILINYH